MSACREITTYEVDAKANLKLTAFSTDLIFHQTASIVELVVTVAKKLIIWNRTWGATSACSKTYTDFLMELGCILNNHSSYKRYFLSCKLQHLSHCSCNLKLSLHTVQLTAVFTSRHLLYLGNNSTCNLSLPFFNFNIRRLFHMLCSDFFVFLPNITQ